MTVAEGSKLDAPSLARVIRGALPGDRARFELHEPWLGDAEREHVLACIDQGWVSSAAPYVERFERELARVSEVRRAVATNSGTAALHIALLLAGVRPGDEVLVPALSFVATANAVAYCGGVPHFVDCSARAFGMDSAALERHLRDSAVGQRGECTTRRTGRRIAAVIPVHVFGHPAELDSLAELARFWGLVLVQDAAQALGTLYGKRPVCHGARLAAVSFNGNKIVTTGGGGAILTDDDDLAERARSLVRTARRAHPLCVSHGEIGFSYAMPGLNAALGCGQLERLEEFVERKRAVARLYARVLPDDCGASLLSEPDGARSNYWLNALVLERSHASERDALLECFHASGVMARPAWQPLHTLPMYQDAPRAPLEVTEDAASRIICLPSSSFLAESGK